MKYSQFTIHNSHSDLESALSALVDLTYHSFHCETLCLFLLDPEGGDLVLNQFRSSRASLKKEARIEIGEGIVGWTAKEGRELLVERFDRPTRTLGYYTGKEVVNSILSAPVLLEGSVEGVLVTDRKEGSFEVLDRERIKEFARQTATLIGLFRSAQASQETARRFSIFHEMSKGIAGRLHFDEVLDWICETVEKTFFYDEMVLVLLKGNEGVIQRRQGYLSGLREGSTFPLDHSPSDKNLQSLSGLILKNNVPLLIEDLWKDGGRIPVFYPGETPLYRSFVGTPLNFSNEPMGILTLLNREKKGFQEVDSHLLDLLGQMASQSLERSRLYEQTEDLAIRDGLTGLFNHRHFQETLTTWMERQKSFALLLIDVDHFKGLNDQYGHPVGDEVLNKISRILTQRTGERDFVGRYGGEEFCILTPLDGVEIAEEIREEIQNEFRIPKSEIRIKVTISIGVARYPRDADEKRFLIEKADQNLYHAKEKGRNRVVSSRTPRDKG